MPCSCWPPRTRTRPSTGPPPRSPTPSPRSWPPAPPCRCSRPAAGAAGPAPSPPPSWPGCSPAPSPRRRRSSPWSCSAPSPSWRRRALAERVRRTVRVWALTGTAGVAAGTLLLVTSPGARHRRDRYDAGTASMLAPDSLLTSLKLFARVLETVLTTWQYAGAVAAGVLLGLLARRRPDAGPAVLLPCRPLRLLSLGAGTVLACGYLCTVITYPVFGTRVLTTERTWNDYLLPYVLLLVATGALLGRALRRAGRPAALRYAAAAVSAAVCAAAVAGLAVPLHRLGGDMRDRAERWDRQDRFLRERAASGARTAPYTPNTVARMLEPFGAGGARPWPARCVADYYRLDRVTDGRRAP
ncbi:DUF6056 family protein [Streptomyces sudanensis]|nr:DUF6056 family protein [Streptomyces sudanensis]MCP9960095.1 DUF6056 family protein [Streptomyces sudanensis]